MRAAGAHARWASRDPVPSLLGEFESLATAALLGSVGSVLPGGFGTLVVAGMWVRLFPAMARRDALAGPR